MNLTQLMLELNIQKGQTELQQLTNTLIVEDLLADLKQQTYPLLMSGMRNEAFVTDAFRNILIVLLFEKRNIKEISSALCEEVGIFLTNAEQESLNADLRSEIKQMKDQFLKKAHKPWINQLISDKEQEAKRLLQHSQTV